jgi:large subunit ribosomal protein L10
VPLRLEDKKAIVAELAEVAQHASSVVAAEYSGLKGADMTALRARARKAGVHLQVVRNTLARRVLQDTDFVCMQEALVGPLVLAFSKEEPGAAARLFRDFVKENQQLRVKALSVGGQLLAATDLSAVADLPTYDEALARLMSVMLGPITKLVQTLAEPQAKLVRTLAALRDKMQGENA